MPVAPLKPVVFSLLMLSALSTSAYTSVKGTFSVDEVKGCVNFTTNITIIPTAANGNCVVFNIIPGDGAIERQNASPCTYSYTYTKTGQFWLKVRVQGGANNTDSIRITVEPDLQPQFEINSCNNNAVQVKITDPNYDQYFLDFDYISPVFTTDTSMASGGMPAAIHRYVSAGTFQIAVQGKDIQSARNCTPRVQTFVALGVLPMAAPTQLRVAGETAIEMDYAAASAVQYRLDITLNSGTSFQQLKTITSGSSGNRTETVADLNTKDNYYCLRLRTFDPCTGASNTSNAICSMRLGLEVQDDVNQLAWVTSGTGVQDFKIRRSDRDPLATVTTLNYADTDLVCDTEYCYRITAQYTNGSSSISSTVCGISKTARIPPAIRDVASELSADGTEVTLAWSQPGGATPKEFAVYRSDKPSNPDKVIPTSYTSAIDITGVIPTFYLTYEDVCGKNSPLGQTFQPIGLEGNLEPDNSIRLSWSNYTGYKNGIRIDTILKFDANGRLLSKFTSNTNSFYDTDTDTVNQVVVYRIKSMPADPGLPFSLSHELRIKKEARLIFPNAFTPDDNNLNENFRVYGQFVKRVRLQIFDRWGTQVFTSDSDAVGGTRAWDGSGPDGKPVPQSVYVWKAELTDFSGARSTLTGSIALLRRN